MADRTWRKVRIDPTPHRRQQARRGGQVARSQDLSSAGLLLAGAGRSVRSLGGALLDFLVGLLIGYLSGSRWLAWLDSRGSLMPQAVIVGQWNALVPASGQGAAAACVLLVLLAVGREHRCKLAFCCLPGRVGARLVAGQSAGRAAAQCFRLWRVVAVRVWRGQDRRRSRRVACCEPLSIAAMSWCRCRAGRDLPQIAAIAPGTSACGRACKIGLALLALAVLDYGFERWKHERDLKMTPQEAARGNAQPARRSASRWPAAATLQRQLALDRLTPTPCPGPTWWWCSQASWPWPCGTTPRAMRAPLVVARGSRRDRRADRRLGAANTGCRSSKTASWPALCTTRGRAGSADPRPSCTPPWPRCWPTRTS